MTDTATTQVIPVEAIPDWRLPYIEARKNLAAMMEAHKVTVTAKRVDKRPDDGMGDSEWRKTRKCLPGLLADKYRRVVVMEDSDDSQVLFR